jgi:phosphatidate cytidylyltransferase
MKQRAITAVFFAVAMIGGIYLNLYSFFWLFLAVAVGCLWELMSMMLSRDEPHFQTRRMIGMLLGLLPVLLIANTTFLSRHYGLSTPEELGQGQNDSAAFAMVLMAVLTSCLFITELFFSGKSPFANIGAYLLGVFYVGVPIAMLFSLATTESGYHPHRVFGLLWLVWTSDTIAYLVGSQIGRTKLFERISPKKTWEGTLGGVVGTVAMAWLISLYVPDFTQMQWLALGLVVAVFGTLGDLVESMLKRSVGVKDSGKLLPGHGGLLDRFDAFIFVLPFAWATLKVLELSGRF